MSRRGSAGVRLALGSLALLLAGCRAEPRFDNLLVVMIDTLRSDHLPGYGYPRDTAPRLTALGAEGIQLQGYAASSWTKPSVTTLLSGCHPQRHQAISRSDHLPDALPYLPQLLAGKGFATAGFVANRNVGRGFGFARGFTHFAQTHAGGKLDGSRVTAEALALAEQLRPPFFFYVHYVDPHDPYRPRRTFSQAAAGAPAPGDEPRRLLQPQRLRRQQAVVTAEMRAQLIDQYDGEILEVDAEVGRLLAALDQRGLLARTLVVITADHGEEFAEHGGLTHGATLHEEVLRVPLILWARQGLPRYRSAERFHQVDFLPTVLDALGQELPPALRRGIDGTSRWAELLAQKPPGGNDALLFHLDLDRRAALAALRWPHKLIHDATPPHTRRYDLEADAGEQRPAAGGDASQEPLLAELLREHNRLGSLAVSRQSGDLDRETRAQLAALGYMEVDTPVERLAERVLPARLDRRLGLAAPTPPSP